MSASSPHPVSFKIPHDKLTRYLLNLSHPRGGAKARFFLAFGFDPGRPMELADALASHVLAVLPPQLPTTGVEGEKLIYEGPIAAPGWSSSLGSVDLAGRS